MVTVRNVIAKLLPSWDSSWQGLEVQVSPLRFNWRIPSFYGAFETKTVYKKRVDND
jgi:hypothetical protein